MDFDNISRSNQAYAKRIMGRVEGLQSDRSQMHSLWQTLAKFVNPTRSFTDNGNPSDLGTDDVFDDTAKEASQTLSAALSGMLTNQALKWLTTTTMDYELDQREEVRRYHDDVTNQILLRFGSPAVSFYTAINEAYSDLTDFGTAVIYAPRGPRGIRFQSLSLHDCFLDRNSEGVIDTCYYKFKYTAAQAIERFGDNAPITCHREMSKGNGTKQFGFIQAVMPRRERDINKRNRTNKKWASAIIAVEPATLVEEGGFDEFPFITPRWRLTPNSVYGVSQGMVVLDEIKMVNAASRSEILALEIMASPPVQVPSEGFTSLDLGPNGVNFYQAGMETLIQPVNTNANPQAAGAMLSDRREIIRRAYFNDLFQLPEIDRMTAFEARVRNSDRQILLNPMVGRLQAELLNPAVQLAFGDLKRTGELPETPSVLKGRPMSVEYLSPLALNQRASEIQNFQQYVQTLAPLAEQDPSYLERLHPERLAKWLQGATNTPQVVFRTSEEYEAVQQQRQQQDQLAAASEAAGNLSSAAKDAASAQAIGGGAFDLQLVA